MCSLSLFLHVQIPHPIHSLPGPTSSQPASPISSSLSSSVYSFLLLSVFLLFSSLFSNHLFASLSLFSSLLAFPGPFLCGSGCRTHTTKALSPPMPCSSLASGSISHRLCVSSASASPAKAVSFSRIATLYGSTPAPTRAELWASTDAVILPCSSHQAKEMFSAEANTQISIEKAEWFLPGQTWRLCHPGGLLQHRLVFRLGKSLRAMCLLLHPLAHPDKPERSPASSAEGGCGFTQGMERTEEESCSLPAPCFFAVSRPDLSLCFHSGAAESAHLHAQITACFMESFFVFS